MTFHFEKLWQSVESITQIDIFVGLEGMNLIVLGGHEKRSDTQKLKIILGDSLGLVYKHEVDELHTDKHGLISHLKLATNL